MRNRMLFLPICIGLSFAILPCMGLSLCSTPKHEKTCDSVPDTDIELCVQKATFIDDMERLDSYSNIGLCDSVAYAFMVGNGIQHPNIVLAQMKVESGNYQSGIAKKNNNYFGMRHPAQRLTVSLGQKNGYARYRNWAYSVIDYGLWQRRYAYNLTEEEYLTKLSNTYAEDPNYVSKVKNIAKNLENAK